jgi:dTDP-4-amino-4,6-dideoxygalactose transaminase
MSKLIKHSNPTIKKKDLENVLNCLITDEIAPGNLVKEFEDKLTGYLGAKHGLATMSAESALHLILISLGAGCGDEIILPSYYYSNIMNVINYTGATPVLADLEEGSYHLSLEDVKSKINDKTKAVIIPHMFGLPANIKQFLSLGPKIIEDCSHSLGSEILDIPEGGKEEDIIRQKTGTFADFAFFSFYATRMMTTGQGGFLTCKTKKSYEEILDLIMFDEREDYKIRYSYKLSDMQAALGIRQVDLLDFFINVRKEIASIYNKKLMEVKRKYPDNFEDRPNIYYRYPVRIKVPPKEAIELYKNQGIEAKRPVYKPLHVYAQMDRNLFPNTEDAYMNTISVPIYPTLTKSSVDLISKVITKV